MTEKEKNQSSQKESETSNWQRFNELLENFYKDIQFYKHFVSNKPFVVINKTQYINIPLAEQKTEGGILKPFMLERLTETPKKPYVFTIRMTKTKPTEVAFVTFGWRYFERPDRIVFCAIGVKDKKITRIGQTVRPNGFIKMDDPENDKNLTQVCQVDIDYQENRQIKEIKLQIGYEAHPEKATFNYIPQQQENKEIYVTYFGRKIVKPSLSEFTEALKNIMKMKKAIELKTY